MGGTTVDGKAIAVNISESQRNRDILKLCNGTDANAEGGVAVAGKANGAHSSEIRRSRDKIYTGSFLLPVYICQYPSVLYSSESS